MVAVNESNEKGECLDVRKTVVAVYTGQGLAEPLKNVFQELLPDCRLVNIVDDSLIHDVMQAGRVTPLVAGRLMSYYRNAVDIGAYVILNTCSSVGETADQARAFIPVPIVKIDELMAQEAVRRYARIGVIATLPTTLRPTMSLLRSQAQAAGRTVELVDGLAEGAYDALVGSSPEEHDRLISGNRRRDGGERGRVRSGPGLDGENGSGAEGVDRKTGIFQPPSWSDGGQAAAGAGGPGVRPMNGIGERGAISLTPNRPKSPLAKSVTADDPPEAGAGSPQAGEATTAQRR